MLKVKTLLKVKTMLIRALACSFTIAIAVGCGDDPSSMIEDDPDQVEFSNVRVEEITATSAVVRFTTSLPTTCEVEYGTAADALDDIALDPSMTPMNPHALDHEVPLSGLDAASVYFYRARASTPEGDTFFSAVADFTTMNDTTDPGMMNVAMLSQGASVVDVSSNFGGMDNDSTWGIHNALDGDPGTEWATNGDGDDAFVMLDLGQSRTITQVKFQSRRMTDGSSIITQFRLRWSSGMMTRGPFDAPDPLQMYTFDIDPPITTDSLRIEAVTTTGGNTGTKEIQLLSPMSL